MKTSGNPDAGESTEADYDFSDVESSELDVCNFYEYARESRAARGVIAVVRKQLKQRKRKAGKLRFGLRVQNQIQRSALTFLSLSAGFPDTPWRRLSDKDKQRLLKMVAALPALERYASTWPNPPLAFVLNEPGTTTLDLWKQQYRKDFPAVSDDDPIEFGFFAVNLKYGHPVLIEEFEGQLRHFEGKPLVEFPSLPKKVKQAKPGRPRIRDALNQLGAMRLRYYCDTFDEALEKMKALRDKPHGMFYGRQDNFNRACNAARSCFQENFGWLDSKNPFTSPKTGAAALNNQGDC